MRVICVLSLLLYTAAGLACPEIDIELDCNDQDSCSWTGSGTDYQCTCKSDVKLDILFGVDASGSVGSSGYKIQRDFVKRLVTQGVNNGSRIGFFHFASKVNADKEVQFWDEQELSDYVDDFVWTGGWTNTPELLRLSILEFQGVRKLNEGTTTNRKGTTSYQYEPGRQQILIILTDGVPCGADLCPKSVCYFAPQLTGAGIRTIIIGIGDALAEAAVNVKCLVDDDDWIPVSSFSDDDFNSIMGSLSGVLCPDTKECKLTEVKAMRKPGTWQTVGDGRMTRFIEIFNSGVNFQLSTLKLEGLVDMDGTALPTASPSDMGNVWVEQSQYIVFYDAADLPATTRVAGGAGPSVPTCHNCRWDCAGKTGCVACGLDSCANKHSDAVSNICFCDNSVYIACNTNGDSCPADNPDSLEDDNGLTATNGCSYCTFNDLTGKIGWTQTIKDDTDFVINSVTHDALTWITTRDRYSYELIGKGMDNTVADNWAQSCSKYGTPGSDPYAVCDDRCNDVADCGTGALSCWTSGDCNCDKTTGYYPHCTVSLSGVTVCLTCKKVPEVDDCDIIWLKNGTTKYAAFNWTDNDYDDVFEYQIEYFSNTQGVNKKAYTDGERYWTTTDYDTTNKSFGGFISTRIQQCITEDVNGQQIEKCDYFYSIPVICDVTTSAPTLSPTHSPSNAPTPAPSQAPTGAPTWSCPRYWFTGGNTEICGAWSDNSRCSCNSKPQTCCLKSLDGDGNVEAADFTVPYDANRLHEVRDSGDCRLDVQYSSVNKRGTDKWDASEVDQTYGYLLSAKNKGTEHFFSVDISPDSYPCDMDICWALEFNQVSCDFEEEGDSRRRRTAEGCSATTESLASVGLDIDVVRGCMEVAGAADEAGATFSFTVKQAECTEEEEEEGTSRRRLGTKCDLFDNVAIYGELVIVNATSKCDLDCEDGRIYPMRIPVWYNYASAFTVPPSQETELPAWLWWLIAALVIFLALLAFLLYRYWWKNKKTGAALGNVQKDLDGAVMEMEDGFGAGCGKDAVGFNPLATGFNPNSAAGVGNPNGPPVNGGGPNDYIKPMNNPEVFRMEYGQKQGGIR